MIKSVFKQSFTTDPYYWILIFYFHSENLALKKSTRISSNFQISKDSSTRAVDGNKEQHMPECTMTTSGQRQAWWQVDLGVERSVSHLRVFYQESTWPFVNSTIHNKTPKTKPLCSKIFVSKPRESGCEGEGVGYLFCFIFLSLRLL